MAISKEKQQHIYKKRRNQILTAAMKLFNVKGYTNTRVSDISEKAKISKGLIYRYFNSKEEIILSLVDKLNECIDECYAMNSARDAIKTFSLRLLYYPYYDNYVPPLRVFFSAITRGEIDVGKIDYPVHEDFGREYFGNLFARGQKQGEFKPGDPKQYGEIFWNYLTGYMANMKIKEGKHYQPDIDAVLKLFEF